MMIDIDPRLREAIFRAVKGEPSWWPIDRNYPQHGTQQERFDAGDRQMLLWAIVLAADEKRQIPRWATNALEAALLTISTTDKDWRDVFGGTRAKRGGGRGANSRSMMMRAKKMLAVWDLVHELKSQGWGIGDKMFAEIGQRLHISGSTANRYYSRMKRYEYLQN
jgi:hypothetical protein